MKCPADFRRDDHAITAVCEMLVEAGNEVNGVILAILDNPKTKISDLVKSVGVETAVRIANHLGNCHLMIVHDDNLVRTHFGELIVNRINKIAEEKKKKEADHKSRLDNLSAALADIRRGGGKS